MNARSENFDLSVIFVLTYHSKTIITPRTNHYFYENITQLLHQSSDTHRRWICCEFQVLLYERTPRSQRNIVDGRRENYPTPWQAACDQQLEYPLTIGALYFGHTSLPPHKVAGFFVGTISSFYRLLL
jgi:hypothetical protein